MADTIFGIELKGDDFCDVIAGHGRIVAGRGFGARLFEGGGNYKENLRAHQLETIGGW